MIANAQELLAAFDSLPADEKKQVTVELLRRSSGEGDMPESAFDEIAAELFRAYDAEEARSADS